MTTIENFYKEPWLSIGSQIEHLRNLGCEIDDEEKARRWLEAAGLSRIEGYLEDFLDDSGKYLEGTRITDVMKLYSWDNKLKAILLEGARAVEIAVRVAIAHQVG